LPFWVLCIWLSVLPVAVFAADYPLRPGDRPFDAAELATRLDAQILQFYDGGRSRYGPGNAYAYLYSDQDIVSGTFEITDEGEVCITFTHGPTRCDLYVMNGDRLYLIDQKGDRYPVR
jgi:hypothetical protein